MVPTCEVVSAAIEAIAVLGTGPLQVDAVTTAIDPVVDLTVTVVIDVITDFIRRLSDLATVGGYATITGQLTFSSTSAETTIGRHRDKVFVGVSVTVVVDGITEITLVRITRYTAVLHLATDATGLAGRGTGTNPALSGLPNKVFVDAAIAVIVLAVTDVCIGGNAGLAVIDDGTIGADLLAHRSTCTHATVGGLSIEVFIGLTIAVVVLAIAGVTHLCLTGTTTVLNLAIDA